MPDFLRYRQIHLDFHTSEQLPNIGGEFDGAAWAQQLVDAHVDSITCFARGHHGMIFYETQAHPERRHPNLQSDLLSEQIRAGHARDIRVPIYTTVQWDYYTAPSTNRIGCRWQPMAPSRARSPTRPVSMRNSASIRPTSTS